VHTKGSKRLNRKEGKGLLSQADETAGVGVGGRSPSRNSELFRPAAIQTRQKIMRGRGGLEGFRFRKSLLSQADGTA
jgi:hypothetical protein